MSNWKGKPAVIVDKRTGKPDDPFSPIDETLTVNTDGKVILSEIPDSFEKVSITGLSKLWKEIKKGVPSSDEFKVDYNNRIVTLNAEHGGKQLNFSYKGTGVHYVDASMIYTEASDGLVTETLKDLTNETSQARNLTEQLNQEVSQAENTRELNEDERINQEISRESNETSRSQNENTRISNENTRKSSENTRQTQETTRQNNENDREQSEATRLSNESARETNEQTRQTQEQQRQTNTSNAISNAETATTDANNAASYANTQGDYAKGIRDNYGHKGEFDPNVSYKDGNVVTYAGTIYMCISPTTPGITPMDGNYWTPAAPQATFNSQKWIATEGQDVFEITNGNYAVGSDHLEVWVGGVPQTIDEGYVETDATTITLTEPVSVGVVVYAKWVENTTAITKNHTQTHYAGGNDEMDVTRLKNYKEQVDDRITPLQSDVDSLKSKIKLGKFEITYNETTGTLDFLNNG